MKLEFCEQMQEFRLKFRRFGDTLVFVKQWHCAAVIVYSGKAPLCAGAEHCVTAR